MPNSALPCSVRLTAGLGPDLTRDLRLFSVRGLNGATILLSHFYFQPKCCGIEGKSRYIYTRDNTMLEIYLSLFGGCRLKRLR